MRIIEKLFRSRKVNVSKEQFPMKLIEFFNKFGLFPSEYFGKEYLGERRGHGKLLRIKVYVDGKETNDPNTMINETSKIIVEEQIAMRKERTVIGKRAKVVEIYKDGIYLNGKFNLFELREMLDTFHPIQKKVVNFKEGTAQ